MGEARPKLGLSTMWGGVLRWGPSFLSSKLFLIFLVLFISRTSFSDAVDIEFIDNTISEKIIWCTVNLEEQYKCGNLSKAIERDRKLFSSYHFDLGCKQASNKDECTKMLDEEKADVTVLDSGEIFVAGRFHSLVPIMQEVYENGIRYTYTVAVVKRGTSIGSEGLQSLRGTKACFPVVGSYAGWIMPVNTLMNEGGMKIVDCNNHVKSVIDFFGPSCAPNSLHDKNNPIGDNSDKLCELCTGRTGTRCTLGDPYAGFTGALRCLLEAGDIAFLKHSTVPHVLSVHSEFNQISSDKFELLCKDGSRRSVTDYKSCNWGTAPANALVTTTAKSEDKRKRYQKFIHKVVEFYSTGRNTTSFDNRRNQDGRSFERDQYGNQIEKDQYGNVIQRDAFGNPINPSNNPYGNDYSGGSRWNNRYSTSTSTENYGSTTAYSNTTLVEKFNVFESVRYGVRTDLLFDDTTQNIYSVPEDKQLFKNFLGPAVKEVLAVRECPIKRFTLCVTSDAEMEKCVKMRAALKAQLLKPDMSCHKGHSHINCMQAISGGIADAVMLDAADVWEAARHYSLEPILSEVYGLGETSYYAVAVAKEQDPDTEITYLKGKNTCHSGIGTAAGWMYPLAYLISNGWIRPYGCDAARAAAEWFSRSCVPGAMSPEYNLGVPHKPLCRLCHGSSFSFCRRDASEAYYGSIGALRCLTEGGGDVAFVRHSTVLEIAGGFRKEWWIRNTLKDDFQLLCPDGTRGMIKDFKTCNLGKVPGNAMVTRGGDGRNETEIAAFTNLMLYAQSFYGTTTMDDFSFSMFTSAPPYFDLIFSDSTRQLQVLKGEMRRPSKYLGRVFMRAHMLTDCGASTSSANQYFQESHIVLTLLLAVSLMLFKNC